MKKIFILGLVISAVCLFFNISEVRADNSDIQIIKSAINKYKLNNYIGCISDLRQLTARDPSNAVAWYYLGSSYMNIAMKKEAHNAFEKVINLNTVPKLTSYSIQAKICMENEDKCKYQDFTYDEIKQLRLDPVVFLEQYTANQKNQKANISDIEIEKLIKGTYSNNIHPTARDFIRNERAKMEQNEINANEAYVPVDNKMAQAVSMLSNQNNDISSFAMIMDNNQQNNNYADLLKYYQQNKNNKAEMNPQLLQLMLMSNMTMPGL